MTTTTTPKRIQVCRFCGKLAAPGLKTCGPCGVGFQVQLGRRPQTPDPSAKGATR